MGKAKTVSFVKISILTFILMTTVFLCACGGNEKPQEEEQMSNAEISEIAMTNFLDKISESNYVVDVPNYLKTNVCSKDLIYFDYYDDISYKDFAVMTVNEKETFQTFFSETGIKNLAFVDEGKAVEIAGEKLLGNWTKLANGNIWNLFYNVPTEPLKFLSNSEMVKASFMEFANVGEMFLSRMQNVFLILDAQNPTTAHITTSFTDGYPQLNDIDVTVTFGNAVCDQRAMDWINNDNREYPSAKTSWGDDAFYLNSVFMFNDGEKAVPFVDFATCVLKLNEEDFYYTDEIRIRDSRATEQGMQDYIEKLETNGFVKTTEDGVDYYRLKLRDYPGHCPCLEVYSSIQIEYQDGINLVAKKYYAKSTTTELSVINDRVGGRGFCELLADDNITGFYGEDITLEHTESLYYLCCYDAVFKVEISYEDFDDAQTYMGAYVEALKNLGFVSSVDQSLNYYSCVF